VILASYAVYGDDFLKELRGMFAFALYDGKKNKVLIARDRIGIKPFYYRQWRGSFLFASEIKALIHLEEAEEEINQRKVYEFIANRQLDTDDETFFTEIRQLPPAHFAWVSPSGKMSALSEYWRIPEIGNRKWNNDATEEFLQLFNDTIRLHLRSDVPVGCFVSGGLDSSSVACFAEKQMRNPLYTYSGVLPYFNSENALIKDVTESGRNIVPTYFPLDGKSFFDDLPRLIYHHDEPILDGSMYSHYKLCELAGRDGLKVLLSGAGGDELFGGYESHLYSHLGQLLRSFRLPAYLRGLRDISGNSMYSFRRLLVKSIFENVPVAVRRTLKNRQLKGVGQFLEIAPRVPHFYHNHSNLYYANWLNNYRNWTVPPYLHYEDRNSMAFGVEIRVPFFDHLLIEYIAQFDTREIVNGRSKSLMRKSFKGIVPDSILEQKDKFGFPSPIDHALQNDQKGKELFFDSYRQVPYLKEKETEQLARSFYNGTGDLKLYFRTLSYALWYKGYKEGYKTASDARVQRA
jgi:asparagine synthase (glutamine-hydrolysing)